jgi:hypothetical protein
MGLIQELVDLVSKLTFVDIVHEYEQGLYFRNGVVIEKATKGLKAGDLAQIKAEEKKIQSEIGRIRNLFSLQSSNLPEGFRKTWTGRVLHPHRFSKVLKPGVYFHLPIIEHIITDYKQERVLNLGYISVLTKDPEPECKAVIISCNIRYEVMDLYRAYTAVYDYKASLTYHSMSIMALKSLGKKYDDWKDPVTINTLEKQVIEELRKIVTEKWGLKIHQIYITDVTNANIVKFVGEVPDQSVISETG